MLGAGKAGGAMAAALEAAWPAAAPMSGLVVTRYDSVPPAFAAAQARGSTRIEVVQAAHPVPDEAGRRAAARILELARGLSADDLVVCLMSGGASSLLALPAAGVTLDEKQAINSALLKSGAAIDEMNCVRKHLSAIKGGRLAAACAPARVVTLLVSDVPGDSPSVIGSGPTVPDPTTCADALAVLERLRASRCRRRIRADLESGALETPKPGDAVFAGNEVHLVATPQQSLDAAAALARSAGHRRAHPRRRDRRRIARGRQGARRAGAPGRAPRPAVRAPVRRPLGRRDDGDGEAARAAAAAVPASSCSAAPWRCRASPTSGRSPPTPTASTASRANAGAFVTPDTLERARRLALSGRDHLDRNDAYSFFAGLDDLLVTGPTFTNVNDFRAILIL